jgi:hypothetical protein
LERVATGKISSYRKEPWSAIKDVLVMKYGVTANRPKRGLGGEDTNDTLEGRAHDRRVERMKIFKNRIPGQKP